MGICPWTRRRRGPRSAEGIPRAPGAKGASGRAGRGVKPKLVRRDLSNTSGGSLSNGICQGSPGSVRGSKADRSRLRADC